MWVSLLFVAGLVGAWLWLIRAMSRRDFRSPTGEQSRGFRRAGGAALGAFGEILENHAAEHQRIEEHAADVNEDDDGDGGDGGRERRRDRASSRPVG